MSIAKPSLFLSGLFFGGAVDHVILGSLGRRVTPYGFESGIVGNWILGAIDLLLTAALYWVYRRTEASTHVPA